MLAPWLDVSVFLWDGFVNQQQLTTSEQNYKTPKAEAAGKSFSGYFAGKQEGTSCCVGSSIYNGLSSVKCL